MKRPFTHASGLAQVLAAPRRSDTMGCDDLVAEAQRASDMTDEEREAIEAWSLIVMPAASDAIH